MKTNLLSFTRNIVRAASTGATETGQPATSWLKPTQFTLLLAALICLPNLTALASDPVGIFALIDKVVLEPNDTAPERIQIWGSFCFAEGKSGDQYAAPKTGYVYYKLPVEKAAVAKKEWADLKSIAGKREVIGFGARFAEKGNIRKPEEKSEKPDTYPLGWGLARMKDRNTEYAPIRQLLSLARAKSTVEKK